MLKSILTPIILGEHSSQFLLKTYTMPLLRKMPIKNTYIHNMQVLKWDTDKPLDLAPPIVF